MLTPQQSILYNLYKSLRGRENTSIYKKYEEAANPVDVPTFLKNKGYQPRPLKDWKTDFRYLKFGSDRPGGASSSEPFAVYPAPGPYPDKLNKIPTSDITSVLTFLDTVSPNNFLKDYNSNFNLRSGFINLYNANSGPDFPVRGGGTSFDSGYQTTTLAGQVDMQRIKTFMKSDPRGALFIRKQKDLQFSNPLIETGEGLEPPAEGQKFSDIFSFSKADIQSGASIFGSGKPAWKQNTRVYNEKNTIAQVGASGTGVHALRAGFSPFEVDGKYYEKTVSAQLRMEPNVSVSNNRLLILQQLKLTNQSPIVNLVSATTAGGQKMQALNMALAANRKAIDLGLSTNSFIIQDYLGGPTSAYGVGFTTVRRYVDTSPKIDNANQRNLRTVVFVNGVDLPQDTKVTSNIPVNRVRSGIAMKYEAIAKQSINSTNNPEDTYKIRDIQDFILANSGENLDLAKINDRDQMYYGARDPKTGLRGDHITNTQISIAHNEDPWTTENGKKAKDLIKFGFEIINYTTTNTFLPFRAFLTNGFTDTHTATWNSFRYAGRAENFYTYQGVERAISFGFKILVEDQRHLQTSYSKLDQLIRQVYPDYSEITNAMRAPIIRLTVGDYFYRLPGIIESISVTAEQNASWDIDDDSYQVPQFLNVQISFKAIASPDRKDTPKGDIIGAFANAYTEEDMNPEPFEDSRDTESTWDRIDANRNARRWTRAENKEDRQGKRAWKKQQREENRKLKNEAKATKRRPKLPEPKTKDEVTDYIKNVKVPIPSEYGAVPISQWGPKGSKVGPRINGTKSMTNVYYNVAKFSAGNDPFGKPDFKLQGGTVKDVLYYYENGEDRNGED
jgi:hypothetical protein